MKKSPLVVVLACLSFGLIAGAIAAAILASRVDCGIDPIADCQALKMALWQRAVIPGALGIATFAAFLVIADRTTPAAVGSEPGVHESGRP